MARAASRASSGSTTRPPRSAQLVSNGAGVSLLYARPPLLSFLRGQLAAMTSGGGHHGSAAVLRQSLWQRIAMGLSSASYLGVAVTWHLYGFVRLGRLFWLIAGLSISADAGADLLPSTIIGRARIADRLCGTTGLVLSVAFNCTSPSATALSLLATVSAVAILAKGRAVANAEPRRRTKYLVIHGLWHVYGAAVLSAVTVYAQPRARG